MIRWGIRLAIVAAIGWLGIMAAYRWVPTWCLHDISDAENRASWLADGVLRWREDESARQARRVIARIEPEIRASHDHPWAGKYEPLSADRDAQICLSPTMRFATLRAACTCGSEGYWGRSGVIQEVTDSSIALRPAGYAVDKSNPARALLRFHRIRWGERTLLLNSAIPLGTAAEPLTFEQLCGWLMCRTADGDGPLDDWPELPVEILAALHEFPATVRVVGIEQELEDRDDLDPARGDLSYEESVSRVFRLELVGDLCLPDSAELAGLFARLPRCYAYRDGDVLRTWWETDQGNSIPELGWRFVVYSAEYDETIEDEVDGDENAEVEEAPEVVAQGQRRGD